MSAIDRDDVAGWSPEERGRVARLLDEFVDRPVAPRPPKLRRVVILTTSIGAAVLVPWIAFLSWSLPQSYSVRAWNVVWIGFDIALAASLAVTGLLVLQRRQIAVLALVITATLLLCDAWFDVCLAWNTPDQKWSLLSAAVEVPLAIVLATSAIRILQRASRVVRQLRGQLDGPQSVFRERFVMVPPKS